MARLIVLTGAPRSDRALLALARLLREIAGNADVAQPHREFDTPPLDTPPLNEPLPLRRVAIRANVPAHAALDGAGRARTTARQRRARSRL